MDYDFLTPLDLALKFLLQPRPNEDDWGQCRKGSGFLNGS